MARRSANSVRIIGGCWRGRLIRFGRELPIRPTPDRVRETLFNWLGQDLTGKRCLDLFAGSGALGFEALSRNAAHVTFVDQSRAVCAQLRSTATTLDAARFEIRCCPAIEFVNRHSASASIDVDPIDIRPSVSNATRVTDASEAIGRSEPRLQPRDGTVERGRFDVIFLDPPYGSTLLAQALVGIEGSVAAGGVVYVESDARVALPQGWRIDRQSKAGMVHFGLAVREEP